MPCAADLERRDYLSFLLKRPQGTTKFLGTPAFAGTKTPVALKFSSKGATTDCVETPSTARTAGKSGGCGGACDASPLSCTKIERPSQPEKPPCKVRFFVQNRSRKYRPKVTGTTLFQTAFHRVFQLLSQMAHVCFRRQKWVHTRPCSKNRTQRHTRRNRGCFGWGWYHYPRSVPHVHKHPRAGCQNGVLCRFGILAGRCS